LPFTNTQDRLPLLMKQQILNFKAAIIGVGTELTDGQIANTNAKWISQKLSKHGLQTAMHLTVPDNRKLMLNALNWATEVADVVFLTGGLGPTSDDFTRDVVCEWTKLDLEWHEPSFASIKQKLSSRNIPVRDAHKKECFFPEGARVLANPVGTAPGFQLQMKTKTLIVLPGPPKEIAGIWEDNIETQVQEWAKIHDTSITHSWDTLGRPESEVANKIDEALAKLPTLPGHFEIGYRVHLPYVEVKLSHSHSQLSLAQPYIDGFDEALRSITAAKNNEDIMLRFASQLSALPSGQKIVFYDQLSFGYLQNRLSPFLKELTEKHAIVFSNDPGVKNLIGDLYFGQSTQQSGDGLKSAQVQIFKNQQMRTTQFVSPVAFQKVPERSGQYFSEQSLFFWSQNL
jgi:nicotinamide-nucleotide amidase